MLKKVLIIEDDLDLQDLLAFNLKRAGFSVGTAADGIEGLKKARSIQPDLLLLDIMVPELDGLSVCEILRHDASTASMRIVVMTALSGEFARISSLESGASDYIRKPFTIRTLLSRVEALIADSAHSHQHPKEAAKS